MELVVWGWGQGLALEGVHMLGRWSGFGGYTGERKMARGCGEARGVGENQEGCGRQRSGNEGSPGHQRDI